MTRRPASSAFCRSGGAQMEAMRGTAWVLTHALVNMTNACLSSSFLRTDRHGAFGSRFGPIAKWPFCIQTRFSVKNHKFGWLRKKASFQPFFPETTFFPKPGFVKNGSYPWFE